MLSERVYRAAGKEVDFVRQSNIGKVRYSELIMRQRGSEAVVLLTRVVIRTLSDRCTQQ